MNIRQEVAEDYPSVYEIVKSAFATAEQSDGNEQELVVSLRKSQSFIPAPSLVATVQGKPVGHILFTKVSIGKHIGLALAPLSVLPAYQKQGIGRASEWYGHI